MFEHWLRKTCMVITLRELGPNSTIDVPHQPEQTIPMIFIGKAKRPPGIAHPHNGPITRSKSP